MIGDTTGDAARTARREAGEAGIRGNERLTALNAAVLLGLLAAEGVTILSLGSLFSAHVFIGMALIPPVALKTGTVGWRFYRYYAGDPAYRRRGAPPALLRALGPVVVGATLGVLLTGVALLALGPGHPFVSLLHKASFVVWLGTMAVHVLGHLLDVPRALKDEVSEPVRGSGLRAAAVACALVVGLALGAATVQYAAPWLGHVGG